MIVSIGLCGLALLCWFLVWLEVELVIDYLALFVHPDNWVWYHWVQYFVACYFLWVFIARKK